MLSIVILFFITFTTISVYMFSLKSLNAHFQKVLQKEKAYQAEHYPVGENEVDYTPQLNFFNKLAFSFIILSAILFFILNNAVHIFL